MPKRTFRQIVRPGARPDDEAAGAGRLLLYVGTTTAYHYDFCNGKLYPSGLLGTDMRGYCAHSFDTIEIRSSFYHLPKVEMLADWAEQVPGEFRFALLASSRITHLKRLSDAAEATRHFLRAARMLGPRLGPLLFQLPADFPKDKARLAQFLALLPEDVPVAFEFLDLSWHDDAIYKELHRRNCAVSAGDGIAGASSLAATADWGYVRLERPDYSDQDLARWLEQIRAFTWRVVYLYVRHENQARAQHYARRLEALAAAG